MGFQTGSTTVGYTEDVSLGDFTKLSGNNEGSTVLRLYSETGSDLTRDLYLGLIRGKILEEFDGERWTPLPGSRVGLLHQLLRVGEVAGHRVHLVQQPPVGAGIEGVEPLGVLHLSPSRGSHPEMTHEQGARLHAR